MFPFQSVMCGFYTTRKNNVKHLYLILFLFLVLLAGCNPEDHNYIEVTGNASMRIPTDYINISGILLVKDNDSDALNKKLEDIYKNLKLDLAQISFPLDSLKLSNRNMSGSNHSGEPVVQSIQSIALKVTDFNLTEKIFEILAKYEVDAPKSEAIPKNIDELESKIMDKAIRDARNNAEIICWSIHRRLGKVIGIKHAKVRYFQEMPDIENPTPYNKTEDPYLSYKQKVHGSIHVMYELLD